MIVQKIKNIIFALVGFVMIGIACFLLYSTHEFKKTALQANGIVADIQVNHKSDGGPTYSPIVVFTDRNKKEIRFTSTYSSNPPTHKKGQSVTVLYSPENSQKAKIDGFLSLNFPALVVGAIGLVFVLVTTIQQVLRSKRKKKIQDLKNRGIHISANILDVQQDTRYKRNGKTQYKIRANGHDPIANMTRVYESDKLWFDPTHLIQKGQPVTVYLDPQNPENYYMDISFIPNVHL